MSVSAESSATAPLQVEDITVTDQGAVKRAVSAALLGNAMEWYDFGVYAYLATTIGRVFFPDSSPSAQLLFTFATFAAAFVVRPLGGMFFGPLGDRIGRKKVLATTMLVMAASTFCIGLIPSYGAIGVFAPVLLVVLRLIQGFSTGGEYGGASTFIVEYVPDKRRGFFASFLEFGTLGGYVLAAGVATIVQAVSDPVALDSWAWRIPFLVALPLGGIGLYLRLRLEETPAFQRLEEEAKTAGADTPAHQLRDTFVGQWRPLALCIGLVLVLNVTDYMLLSYMPTYLSSTLGYNETHGLVIIVVVMALMMVAISFVGRWSDRIGRKPLLVAGCVGFFVLSLPSFLLIKAGSYLSIFLGLAILGALLLLFIGVLPSTLPALFPTGVRYGGMAIGYNISVALFGGTTPLLTSFLEDKTGSDLVAPVYLMVAAVIGLVAVVLIPETAGRPLAGSPPSVATDREAQQLAAAGS